MALRDWNPFARDPAPPPELSAALADLSRLTGARPELAPAAGTLADVLRAAFLTPASEPPLHADPELLVAAWRAGVPALRAGNSPPAWSAAELRSRGLAVCEALVGTNPKAADFLRAIRKGTVDLLAWALDSLADRPESVDDRARALDIPPEFARSVLRLALLPTLARLSARLAPLRPEGLWTRGDCPNCGGPPSLAESRGLDQRRFWRCGLCAADWDGERLRCPFCGETDHRRLDYRFAEGEQDRYRLSRCESCGGQLKVISTLAPIPAPGLLVAELATVHLDLSAE